MSYDPTDDPRLTAYALGELDPEQTAEIEELIANNDEARRQVEAMRETAARMEQELGREAADARALTDGQRRAIRQRAARSQRQRMRFPVRPIAYGLAAAVGLVVIAGIVLPSLHSAREMVSTGDDRTVADASDQLKKENRRAQQRTAELSEQDATDSRTKPPVQRQQARASGERQSTPSSRPVKKPSASVPSGDAEPADASDSSTSVGSVAGRKAKELSLKAASGPEGAKERKDKRRHRTPAGPPNRYNDSFNTEKYDHVEPNPFRRVAERPLSTFSIDVDTASYANVRRFLRDGKLPPKGAVRIEELINYFDYGYAPPEGDRPFAAHTEVAGCPWNRNHQLVRIGLKGREIAEGDRPAANLVFLIDVSGSMRSRKKLPLLKRSMKVLAEQLKPKDRVAMVVYAGSSGLVLDSTPGSHRGKIVAALDNLKAGGSTHGSAGIEQAYKVAREHFIEGGVNRVILATDGDFNVGTTNRSELIELIERKRKSGVFLSVLGFGAGNIKDSQMEQLANHGDGNYAYIDSLSEGKKVLGRQVGSTLVTIAKDVKIQVEFNPAAVQSYRLIGYENRMLAKEDFNDDTKDAGEIGAGHTVTALYEIAPAGGQAPRDQPPRVDPLKYQNDDGDDLTEAAKRDELLTLKLRYKPPQAPKEQGTSKKIAFPVSGGGKPVAEPSAGFRFAAAVAEFGMLLRGDRRIGSAGYGQALELARAGLDDDPHGDRAEFVSLVHKAKKLDHRGE